MKPPVYNENWPEQVRHLFNHDMREIWDAKIARHIWNQYHNQLQIYKKIAHDLRPNSILDVGCAQGTLALQLAELDYDVVANDIRPEFLNYAKSRYEKGSIQFIVGNIFEIDLQKKFDLIFANQIIEHLVYPVRFLQQLRVLLNPGGHIVITTPNHAYFINKLPCYKELGDPKKYEDLQFTADADGHFFAYTADELVAFSQDAGFTDIVPFFFETPWLSGHMKVRYLHHFAPVAVLQFLDRCTRLAPWFGKRSCHQLGVVAKLA